MTYTEKELDQFLHGISLSLLSKKSAQHWRYDEETAKEIEWLEVLERKVRADKADRKTESDSEIPNNCTNCGCTDDCSECKEVEHGCKDEPQTDNGIGCSRCEGRYDCCDRDMPHAVRCNNYGKVTDEPQTERGE